MNLAPLRRRPAGSRVMVYLDQSTLSALASEEEWAALANHLRELVREGKLICPKSPEHSSESLLAASWEEIHRLSEELSLGVDFHTDDLIAWYEIGAAAEAFLGHELHRELWQEAFDEDPQAPLDAYFQGGFRVAVAFPPDDYRREEIQYQKEIEQRLEAVYETARKAGHSFDQQTELEFEAMLYGYLGPVLDPDRFEADARTRLDEATNQWLSGELGLEPGSAVGRYSAWSIRKSRCESFVERYPLIADRVQEFIRSEELRSMPALRYPALLRAAIICTPDRKPKAGDGYDISHLTKGLSRCDIVTADAGMTQLVANFKLSPPGCALFPFRDRDGLTQAVEEATRGISAP